MIIICIINASNGRTPISKSKISEKTLREIVATVIMTDPKITKIPYFNGFNLRGDIESRFIDLYSPSRKIRITKSSESDMRRIMLI
ncbi:hypothetical protein BDK61_2744 [Haloarcula quadrata]|uniref:Uncharacterized protein n=1 Tax=Haloarcula quadrata TaxID=182779 RepID=A0A495R7S6_9EURY|nr:hypothetical protein BDK61_2744 [Haloarcula quadrata]